MKSIAALATVTTLLLGLPMLGATWTGRPMSQYLEFPPRTRYVQHAPFSWPAFALLILVAVTLGALFISLYLPRKESSASTSCQVRFPWWGWVSGFFLLCFWTLAWNRFGWFRAFQPFTFTPLWVSYVVLVNAFTFGRCGTCLLTRQTRYLLSLFPASALCWWYFEYLNRFSQNWYYAGQEMFTPLSYTLLFTIAFSTVLPAVISTTELLRSFPVLGRTRYQRPLILAHRRIVAVAMLAFASCGLIGIAVLPDAWYPVIWISPLLILISIQVLLREDNLLHKLERGEWQAVTVPALAALVCGFFWEMWNSYSYPKWVFCIPYIQRFQIFEMPLVGYLGYLPFGLECYVVADLIAGLVGTDTPIPPIPPTF
ncbi:MAG: hypothetical protein JOZ60_08840 [Verrucomicrobia bacterium]|nr:hypothetical protein [Verrucomicrobiota bacterium]